ncbi:Phosphopantetheine attachment site [Grimontia celer]|uniref:Phosphopantetheine attachment site n=1 Tax=Grimontia celer TaxID=1796497 RepID=A0A128EU47_9GAMM|nr:acyl carrier protein [Grimontia celer]CZF77615.1 Phosphopantetheine attachment site [Grimontia celer]
MNYSQEIKAYICEELAPDVSPEMLPSDCNLLKSGVVDSLSLVRLVAWIEEEYDIPTGELDIAPEDFSSVDSINEFIHKHSLEMA